MFAPNNREELEALYERNFLLFLDMCYAMGKALENGNPLSQYNLTDEEKSALRSLAEQAKG